MKSRIERLTPASLAAEVRQFYQDAPIVVHLLRSYTCVCLPCCVCDSGRASLCVCARASCGVAVAVAWGPPPHSMLFMQVPRTCTSGVSGSRYGAYMGQQREVGRCEAVHGEQRLRQAHQRCTQGTVQAHHGVGTHPPRFMLRDGGRDSQSELRVTSADGFWCSSGCRPAPRVCMLRGALVRTLRGGRIPSAQVQYAWARANGDGHHLHQPERVQNPAATVRCVRPCTAALRSATH